MRWLSRTPDFVQASSMLRFISWPPPWPLWLQGGWCVAMIRVFFFAFAIVERTAKPVELRRVTGDSCDPLEIAGVVQQIGIPSNNLHKGASDSAVHVYTL